MNDFETKIQSLALKALFIIDGNHLTEKDFYYTGKGIFGYFKKRSKKRNLAIRFNSYVEKTLSQNKWHSSGSSERNKSVIYALQEDLRIYIEEIEKIRKKDGQMYLIFKMFYNEIFGLGILNQLDTYLEDIKEERGIVHIIDFNRKINQIIENEPVPYIYERIGEKFKHILIDEFQDTSKIQWHNLIPLVSNSLNNNSLSMIVGDAKQAIYRWRGGKAEMLVKLPQLSTLSESSALNEHEKSFQYFAKSVVLDVNYRSCDYIVKFNNAFFEYIIENVKHTYPELASYYAQVQKNKSSKTGGQVQINILKNQAFSKKEKGKVLNTHLKEIILELQEEGYTLQDIAILCRSNKEGSEIANELLLEKIAVISSESLLLTGSYGILLIIRILEILNHKIDKQAVAEIFYYIDIFLKGQTNFSNHTDQLLTFSDSLVKENQSKKIIELLDRTFKYKFPIQKVNSLSLIELVEEIIDCFKLGSKELNQQIYLQKFLDFTLNFTLKNGNNFNDFLKEWERQKDSLSISIPRNSNAVQIMTIHKSKGLQFPIVIIPSIDWEEKRNHDKLWIQWSNSQLPQLEIVILPYKKELENTPFKEDYLKEKEAKMIDNINLLYVSFTRPEDRLIIFTDEVKSSTNSISIKKLLSDFLNEYKRKYVTEWGDYKKIILSSSKTKSKFEDQSESQNNLSTIVQIDSFFHNSSREKISFRRDSSLNTGDIDLESMENFQEQGILLHKALEYIYSSKDIDFALKSLIHQGLITTNRKSFFEEKIKRIINLPEIASFFDTDSPFKIYNERDLLFPSKRKYESFAT